MRYCIDTSSLIEAWRRSYPQDVFPGLWEQLENLASQEILVSSEEVLRELKSKEDELYDWAKKQATLFLPTDAAVQAAAMQILSIHPGLVDVNASKSKGDPFVIAVAMVHNCAVITQERPTGNPDRPKIPTVCQYRNLRCMNFLDFIREQHWQFPLS